MQQQTYCQQFTDEFTTLKAGSDATLDAAYKTYIGTLDEAAGKTIEKLWEEQEAFSDTYKTKAYDLVEKWARNYTAFFGDRKPVISLDENGRVAWKGSFFLDGVHHFRLPRVISKVDGFLSLENVVSADVDFLEEVTNISLKNINSVSLKRLRHAGIFFCLEKGSVSNLDSLETVAQNFRIEGPIKRLPKLKHVGQAYISNTSLEAIDTLETVTENFTLKNNPRLRSVKNLRTVGGRVTVDQTTPNLTVLDALTEVGNTLFIRGSSIRSLPKLKTLGGTACFENSLLEDAHSLEKTGEGLQLSGSVFLQPFTSLTDVGGHLGLVLTNISPTPPQWGNNITRKRRMTFAQAFPNLRHIGVASAENPVSIFLSSYDQQTVEEIRRFKEETGLVLDGKIHIGASGEQITV